MFLTFTKQGSALPPIRAYIDDMTKEMKKDCTRQPDKHQQNNKWTQKTIFLLYAVGYTSQMRCPCIIVCFFTSIYFSGFGGKKGEQHLTTLRNANIVLC